jgi:hypothetical protein
MRLFSLLFFIAVTASAQFPNPGFENWTDSLPDSWTTNNLRPLYVTTTRSAIKYQGSYALKGAVVSYATVAMGPTLFAGLGSQGFAVTNRPASVQGYYQFAPQSGDQFGFSIMLYKGTTLVASAAKTIPGAVTVYTRFTEPFQYYSTATPDLCKAMFFISNQGADLHPGSYFLLDELSLTGSAGTAVLDDGQTPVSFELKQNYPNPFNPTTTISFNLPLRSFVSLKINDVMGREVAAVVSEEMPAGSYSRQWNAADLPSGIYFYRLHAGSFTKVKQLLLLK